MQASDNQQRPELYTILIAAVVQGWALYGLHWALSNDTWPATDKGWLFALYALAFFTPLTVQLLASQFRQRLLWVFVGSLALIFAGFGGHHGASVAPILPLDGRGEPPILQVAALVVLWLMLLPFLQGRLANGRWRTSYREYFEHAWHNKLRLAEAGAFTGALWLLLFMWAGLFRLLGITFFRELFSEPVFVYPVTALAFGIALHLIGAQQKFVTVVLEQILGLLKWLAVVAALILLLFTLTLLPQLPALFGAGRRALSAHWLLWLVAVMVLLLNAAYRDGSAPQPYPRRLGLALRAVAPLLVIVALTALYAVGLRIASFGLTVERAWGLLVALAAVAYSFGYAWAALRPGAWMAAMGRVNVAVALGLIALIALMLTPVLSPWRLSAASQHRMALTATEDSQRDGALRYLRFDGGNYGRSRLAQLAVIESHPRAAELRAAAKRMQGMENPWDSPPVDPEKALAALQVFPAGRELDPALRGLFGMLAPTNIRGGGLLAICLLGNNRCAGFHIDLDADGTEEFVLLLPHLVQVFQRSGDTWVHVANGANTATSRADQDRLMEALQRGEFGTEPPRWPNLRIGERSIDLRSNATP